MTSFVMDGMDLMDRITGALDAALRERDSYTHLHCQRVVELSLGIGQACGLGDGELKVLKTCARFHDIGKIGIPDRVLLKPHRLTPEEYDLIKSHALIGATIIGHVDAPGTDECARIIRHHHEQFDGSGYPDGLCGEAIPLGARIIALADTFDAITSRRTYHASVPDRQALEEMDRGMGTQFDPYLGGLFFRLVG